MKVMIEHVKTKGFKGFDLDEPVPYKALYMGKNKSGKSTRGAAIALAIYGFIPFMDHRKGNAEILDDFGTGDSMTVATKINGVEFERKFTRSSAGTVSQSLRIDKKKAGKPDFSVALSKVGNPVIVDVAEFMKQSDQKKIDTLFSLFPVGDDLGDIDDDIAKAKEEISGLKKQIDGKTAVIQQINESKSLIELPVGSLAEVQKEIEEKKALIRGLQEKIKQAEIIEAEELAKANAKAEAEEVYETKIADAEADFTQKLDEEKDRLERKYEQAELFVGGMPLTGGCSVFVDPGSPEGDYSTVFEKPSTQQIQGIMQPLPEFQMERRPFAVPPASPAVSIQRIIDTMTEAGCGMCAAIMVARVELKKYVGGAS